LQDFDGAIQEAAQLVKECGGRSLHFSKVSVIGQGRGGKSSLINSILGRDFEELQSTAGVKADMIEVIQHHIEGGGEKWTPYKPTTSQLAEAEARMVAGYLLSGNDGLPEISQSSVVDTLIHERSADIGELPLINQESVLDLQGEEEKAIGTAGTMNKKKKIESGMTGPPQGSCDSAENEPGPSFKLVQQFLHANQGTKDSIKLLLEDFGGQDCFYELYSILFSQYAVYVLVFNMEWFLHNGDAMTQGLAYLQHWLLNVQVHCKRASVILVGTHKDKVSNRNEHEEISNLLVEKLGEHEAWNMISEIPVEIGNLCFFPVDNTLGKIDPVLGKLMLQIEASVMQSEHLKHKIPFAWFALLDRVQELKQAHTLLCTHADFLDMCKQVGFPSSPSLDLHRETRHVLDFFSKLGLLLYHTAIPNLIVIRPAEFLFPYFTKFICDFKLHSIAEHKKARQHLRLDFKALVDKGILSNKLLELLWAGMEHLTEVKDLMISFGLMVPICDMKCTEKSEIEFLVPSILPVQPNPFIAQPILLSACAIFDPDMASMEHSGFISIEDFEQRMQVPDGIFSRLICSVAALCQQIPPHHSIHDMQASKNFCLFHLGSSSFTVIRHKNCIGIYILKGSSHEITQMLHNKINSIRVKFLPGFDSRICVPSKGQKGPVAFDTAEALGALTILTGGKGINARLERGEGMVVNPGENLTVEELRDRFGDWITQVFIWSFTCFSQ
jgi:GTPase SAR1 family protein